jgi:hypothetical protein
MTQLIAALDEIADRYDSLYCDLWGCYHNGLRPYPAAVAALRAFRARGGKVLLLTNAPRPASSVAAHLASMGAPEDSFDAIVSSGDAARHAVASGRFGRRVEHIGPTATCPSSRGWASSASRAPRPRAWSSPASSTTRPKGRRTTPRPSPNGAPAG